MELASDDGAVGANGPRELVELICRSLVDDPDAVEVTELGGGEDLVIEVSVEDEDLGRLIGRRGRVAQAIRTVAKAAGRAAPGEPRVLVEFVED